MSHPDSPRLCIDKSLACVDSSNQENVNRRESHIAMSTRYWAAGQTIRIRFLGGNQIVNRKVEEMAKRWLVFANLKFDFVSERDADIRIDFSNNGSWSYIGTDARYIPQNQPTMNYGWIKSDSEDAEYYIVLHEFGHALGLVHEFQAPVRGIPWQKEAVYKYFLSGPYYWNRKTVDHEIFERYSTSLTNSTSFDPSSIMTYHIPQQFILPNNFPIPWRKDLSLYDERMVKTLYPFQTDGEKKSSDKSEIKELNSPFEILKIRFARGEISKEEYLEMRRILEK